MNYLKVFWKNADAGAPIIWYSEINEGRWETRKVGVFSDGTYGYADSSTEKAGMWLSEKALPSFEEIAAQDEFEPHEITGVEFEEVWQKATSFWDAR